MSVEIIELVADETATGERLDRYLAESWGGLSRSQLKQRLLKLSVNGKVAKLSRPILAGELICLELAALPDLSLEAEDIPLDILFENEAVLVINKPAGLVVHPAAGNRTGTLVHGLLHHFSELKDQDFEDESRPGIVHRLDKDTSGVMIIAKTATAHEFLAAQFQARTTRKTYLAIGVGIARFTSRRVEGFIVRDPANRQRFIHHASDGKAACSDFKVLATGRECSLFEVHPLTGRTHQIRVHARYLGFPLVADPIYGKPDKRFPGLRLMLHAWRLEICLPGESQARLFEAALADDFCRTAESLGFGLAWGRGGAV